jgi:hypothetical protein
MRSRSGEQCVCACEYSVGMDKRMLPLPGIERRPSSLWPVAVPTELEGAVAFSRFEGSQTVSVRPFRRVAMERG